MGMKLLAALLCIAALLPMPARADIWLCLSADNKQSIQDKPCGKGLWQKSHVAKGTRVPIAPALRAQTNGLSPARKPPIEVGLQRNKTVICTLLNTEKSDALAQISGTTLPALGENPRDNLVKIEKQRTRVGCDVG